MFKKVNFSGAIDIRLYSVSKGVSNAADTIFAAPFVFKHLPNIWAKHV